MTPKTIFYLPSLCDAYRFIKDVANDIGPTSKSRIYVVDEYIASVSHAGIVVIHDDSVYAEGAGLSVDIGAIMPVFASRLCHVRCDISGNSRDIFLYPPDGNSVVRIDKIFGPANTDEGQYSLALGAIRAVQSDAFADLGRGRRISAPTMRKVASFIETSYPFASSLGVMETRREFIIVNSEDAIARSRLIVVRANRGDMHVIFPPLNEQ